jgi:predicted ArsR family transcriptional regulator
MLKNLRPRQQEIIEILRKETLPLTTIELHKRMGYTDDTGVRRHLAALEARGYLQPRRPREHRAIMLSAKGRAALEGKKAA